MMNPMLDCRPSGRAKKRALYLGVSLAMLVVASPSVAQVATPAGAQTPTPTGPQRTPSENVQIAAASQAASAPAEDIVITGTRIVSSGANSPTPLTVISTEQLLQTTPSNIPDGLNKLPVFQGSTQPRRSGDGGSNGAQNILNLRNFGAQRTLILVDGHRVAPSNPNGTVDVDTIPQMLVQRVDVVTGGASAVYGSDAVTGVVNFILDTKFTGLKVEGNSGISKYGDGQGFKGGVAAGANLFGGRAHVVASFRHQQQASVDNFDRPYGPGVYVLTGSGTTASPFAVTPNTRRADSAFGGKITACVAPCTVLNQQFVTDGVIGAFAPGVTSGTANQNSGGDGAYSPYTTALVRTQNDEAFGRFDFDVTDDIKFFVEGSYARGLTTGWHFPVKLTPGTGQASQFYKNNPYLSAAAKTALGNNGLSNATNTFSLGTYFTNLGQKSQTGARNLNEYISGSTGLTGKLGQLNWDVYYTHGENKLNVKSRNNSNYQKQFAALDAVVGTNGQIQCYAATQAATAAAYAGCVPLNAFGPTATTQAMLDYFTGTTQFTATNVLDDLSGSVTGDLFDLWAGPVKFAVNGEVRWNQYKVKSSASPTDLVDCTGLRICNASLQLWAQPVLANVDVKSHVWEVAGELAVPLLRDLSFAQSLDLTLAGRHTDYSTSGTVNTWKVGLDYRVNDSIRFRGTVSRDIRAPTLADLFQPVQRSVAGFVDLHTGISGTVFNQSQGNPNLTPEISRTYTGGVVLTPRFLPGFNFSVDYYRINMNNAISQIAASNNTVQQLCEASNGTSVYCSVIERPLPFSDRTAANYPTRTYTFGVNAARFKLRGVDMEANYRTQVANGTLSLRLLSTYQPTNTTQTFTSQAPATNVGPRWRVTGFLGYDIGPIAVVVQDRWLSRYNQATVPTQIYLDPIVRAYNTTDVNVELKLREGSKPVALYGTVQNVFNTTPQIVPGAGSIGLFYPIPASQDIMGRYFTVGFRARF